MARKYGRKKMKDKEKQIQEIAQIICGRSKDDICIIDNTSCDSSCCWARIAEAIYNVGYRKADEVRRETAKKIFDALYQWLDLENTEKCGFATIQKFDLLKKFREIYQQLGTEIKE